MAISPIKTPQQMILEQAGIPHMQAGGKTPPSTAAMNAALAFGISPAGLGGGKMAPKDLPADVQMPMYHGQPEFYYFQDPTPVKYYRRGTIPKHTTKEGLETLPSEINANELRNWISVMRAGEKHGVPQFTPEQLTAMVFKEGRTNLGYNQFNYRDPKSLEIYRKLVEEGYDPAAAGFGPAIYDAHAKAKQFGGDPSRYWFGTGVSEDKQTSPQYVQSMKANLQYVNHPKNTELLNTIRDAYDNPVPPPPIPVIDKDAPQNPTQMPNVDIMGNAVGFKKGGKVKPFRDISKVLIQKHISGK
jgi:hypothetical protein